MVVSSMRCPIEGRVIAALRDNTATIEGLADVHVPTLIAWPEHDRILPMARHALRFRTEIPGAEFTVLKGSGHVPMWDTPELVVKTIHDFVSRQIAAAGSAAG
jgi:pimeloyl-ACP methyl ester carboxylesterase